MPRRAEMRYIGEKSDQIYQGILKRLYSFWDNLALPLNIIISIYVMGVIKELEQIKLSLMYNRSNNRKRDIEILHKFGIHLTKKKK